MTYISASSFGESLQDIRSTTHATMTQLTDVGDLGVRGASASRASPQTTRAPEAGDGKWASWKVTVFVVVFCGAFWFGVASIVSRLMG